ncbi:hypothetical protein ABZ883_35480 [Streptomyces sp. NPDC046977]|uniref:hypothetical protein n=1 Tax=Streptomyces sp. NPDC046977 TaxID=3154703 RepID=UPI0033DC7FF3
MASLVTEDLFRTMLAERSGLPADGLWVQAHMVPRDFGVSWPLTVPEADAVLTKLHDRLRQVLPIPLAHSVGSGSGASPGRRYTYLAEITDRYQRCDTRRILQRIHQCGTTPLRPAFGNEIYDPRSERGWGARPSATRDSEGKPNWAWWQGVREAGPRPLHRMPDPYAGEGGPPVDRALTLRGDQTSYREALTVAVREDPRQIDCWAHLGSNAFDRADTEKEALSDALGYYQTAVAVAELSLPGAFTGVLAWSDLDNRPFHRAMHGLGLTWWRLGEMEKAAAVFRNSLWTNPDDNQGIRYLIGQVQAGVL